MLRRQSRRISRRRNRRVATPRRRHARRRTARPLRRRRRVATRRRTAISQEEFDAKLKEIVDEERHTLLSVPGVWEVASEELNNEALDRGGNFEEAVQDILAEMTGGAILQIPGMYEVLSEEFNNYVLREASVRVRRPTRRHLSRPIRRRRAARPERRAAVRTLDDIADDIIEDLKDYPSHMDTMDAVHEAVDGAVPVYYAEQIDMLTGPDWEDIFFQDVADLISGARDIDLSKILPIAIYAALEEKVMNKLNEMDLEF